MRLLPVLLALLVLPAAGVNPGKAAIAADGAASATSATSANEACGVNGANDVNGVNGANDVNGVNDVAPSPANVVLLDGSVLKGAIRRRFLPARSPSLGRIRIDLAKVERIVRVEEEASGREGRAGQEGRAAPGHTGRPEQPSHPSPSSQALQVPIVPHVPQVRAPATFRVSFRNGDILSVDIPSDAVLRQATLLGPVKTPLSKVSSVTFAPAPGDCTSGFGHCALVYHCTFDSPQSIAHPAAGPSGRFLGGSFVPGKKGKALRVEKDAAAFETALPKGFLGPEGCIEFWAKIEGDDPRYVDGGDPLFFSLFDERGAVTLLQFAANNGFARGGLGGAIASWPFGTVAHWSGVMPYEGVLGPDWAGWHHYAMSWKAEGFGDGSFVKVFVDGKPQPVLGGVDDDKVPARLADLPNHAFLLGSPWDRSHGVNRRSKKPFLIDEFKIWGAPKTEFHAR